MKDDENKTATGNTGSDFIDHQQVVDDAKNARAKTETGSQKLDPQNANNPARRNHKTDLSQKKSGGGKQSSPGD
jgi:hypothetical protein